jgi:acyl-CoA synthetase (AMP-forming)/AMP-acid ligase II/thioesterase domain-containing protein/acyl carrier protein
VILADDILTFAPCFWACLRAALTPLALMSAAKDAIYRGARPFGDAVAVLEDPLFLVGDDFADLMSRLPLNPRSTVLRASSAPPAPGWADPAPTGAAAYLLATSGSTGQLKLVEISARAAIFRNFARYPAPAPPEPRISNTLGCFPLDTVTGQNPTFLLNDSVTQISSHTLTVRPTAILDAIEAFDIHTVTVTNSMISRILADEAHAPRARRLGSLRAVGFGAEPISAGVAQEFAALLARHGADPGVINAGYGATETGSLVMGSRALLTGDRSRPACLGRPAPGVAMRIVGDDGALLPAGEVGALEISCPTKMFTRYRGDARLTAESFTADGWWKTGDLGALTGGEITLRGRVKDVLIQNGRKISLADIDAEIQAALGVGAAAHAYLLVDPDTQFESLGVAFASEGAMAEASAAESIRSAVVRRFGFQPRMITKIPADRIPRTASGKIRRPALGQIVADLAPAPAGDDAPAANAQGTPATLAGRLESVWSEVLGLRRPVRPEDHFFELGGDSLRALSLHQRLAEAFGVRVTSEAFVADPTFRGLLEQVRMGQAAAHDATRPQDISWPLPGALRQSLLAALRHWPGERPTADATLVGYNLDGDQPPIFWVFNAPQEPTGLSRALGPRYPLHALRSGVDLCDYSEDEIQTFALRYVSDIGRLRPEGPVVVGGNCQGAIIALAIAQHLLRRKRHVPLLVLMDWAFELQPYQGRVLLIAGEANLNQNPRRAFARPDLAWSRAFAHHDFAEITGGYAEGFDPPHVDGLARVLAEHMLSALAAPCVLMPDSGYQASVTAQKPPVLMRPGARRALWVTVGNESDVAWAPTAASGILLGGKWLRGGQPFAPAPQPRAAIPGLRPGETAKVKLALTAPDQPGEMTLALDLVEEGNRWFGAGGPPLPVRVVPGARWPYPRAGTKSRRI